MQSRAEIARAVGVLGVEAMELPDWLAEDLEEWAETMFAASGAAPLWERLLEPVGVHDPEGRRRVSSFVRGHAVLLVRDAEGLCAFLFRTGTGLVEVIEHCFGFVFYVIDEASRSLLCFNDHDFLIGCGAAAGWVEQM